MLKFEGASNFKNSQPRPTEGGADADNAKKLIEKKLTIEEDKDIDKLPELTPESFEQTEKEIDNNLTNIQKELDYLSQFLEKQKTEINQGEIKEKIEELRNKKRQLELEKEIVAGIKSSIPKDVLKKFDTDEILKYTREKFLKHLKNVNIKALIGYIEAGGIDIKKVIELPSEWGGKFEDIKEKQKVSYVMINPKLFFLSKRSAAEFALKELLERIKNLQT